MGNSFIQPTIMRFCANGNKNDVKGKESGLGDGPFMLPRFIKIFRDAKKMNRPPLRQAEQNDAAFALFRGASSNIAFPLTSLIFQHLVPVCRQLYGFGHESIIHGIKSHRLVSGWVPTYKNGELLWAGRYWNGCIFSFHNLRKPRG